MARGLFLRDAAELTAGALVAVIFGVVGWKASHGSLFSLVPVFLIGSVMWTFLRERLRARRAKLGEEASLAEKLDADIAELQHQRCLLSHVTLWYLAPIMASAVVFSAIVLGYAPIPIASKLMVAGLDLIIFSLCAWAVKAVNNQAVRQKIDPRLKELEELRAALTRG